MTRLFIVPRPELVTWLYLVARKIGNPLLPHDNHVSEGGTHFFFLLMEISRICYNLLSRQMRRRRRYCARFGGAGYHLKAHFSQKNDITNLEVERPRLVAVINISEKATVTKAWQQFLDVLKTVLAFLKNAVCCMENGGRYNGQKEETIITILIRH